MPDNTVWIANDHGGFELKQHILAHLAEKNIPCKNLGSDSGEIVRYPYYAAALASAVSQGVAARGILICSTGIGMSVLANRFPNVRASVCTNAYMAKMTRAHNDSNILCLGGMVTGKLAALDMVGIWLDTAFEGGRHCISLGLLEELDKQVCADGPFDPAAFWPVENRK